MQRIERWSLLFNLLSALKYPLVFALIQVYLPATALESVPGHGLLGGMFADLIAPHVFFTTLWFFAVAWSLMFGTGLLLDRVETQPGRPISKAAQRFFSVPVSASQFWAFTAIGGAGTVIVLICARDLWMATVAAIAGVTVCYLLMILLCTPARLADPDFAPLPNFIGTGWFWDRLDGTRLAKLGAALRRGVSQLFHRLVILRPLLEDTPRGPRLPSTRYFALTNFVGLLLIIFAIGRYYWPPDARPHFPPAAAFLYLLIGLSIWVLLSLARQLARIRISPLVVILLLIIVSWRVLGTDHYYRVSREAAPSDRLTPTEMVSGDAQSPNLVVIASAGGGILASSWTTLVLQRLIEARPELAGEIRLVSGISGGSVGAAHYVAARLAEPNTSLALQRAYDNSVRSSLAETAYGLSMLDFWRLLTGGWTRTVREWDRVRLQEDAWCRIAGDDGVCTDPHPLATLREPIRAGRIPAVILGATVMETGRRVMITPLDFERRAGTEREVTLPGGRAPTLSEYLFGEGDAEANVDLWTGARLSATFAYVSPAASAQIEVDGKAVDAEGQQAHHLLDGGYYENFGVTSALDWMQEALEARLSGTARFDKLLLVRLNAFSWTSPLDADAKRGSLAALLGPALGLAAIRSGVASTRNQFEIERFIEGWNDRLGSRVVAEVEFRPPPIGEGEKRIEPLSWHLTEKQKREQREIWPKDLCSEGLIQQAWQTAMVHLGADCEGADRPRAPVPEAPVD